LFHTADTRNTIESFVNNKSNSICMPCSSVSDLSDLNTLLFILIMCDNVVTVNIPFPSLTIRRTAVFRICSCQRSRTYILQIKQCKAENWNSGVLEKQRQWNPPTALQLNLKFMVPSPGKESRAPSLAHNYSYNKNGQRATAASWKML